MHHLLPRSLSEVHTNKKSSLKYLVECFPKSSRPLLEPEEPLALMMALPGNTALALTHEQVMPFLKKMENGQEREGLKRIGMTYGVAIGVVESGNSCCRVVMTVVG